MFASAPRSPRGGKGQESAQGGRVPKDVLLFLYNPKKRFLHVVVQLLNTPGALSDAARLAYSAGLNILAGFTSIGPDGKIGIWSFFAENTNGMTAEGAVRAISRSAHVRAVRANESDEGLLVDSMHYPLRMTPGREFVGFNRTNVKSMFTKIITTFGTGGIVIIFEEGLSIGRVGGGYLLGLMGRDVLQKKIRLIGNLLSGWGWGLVQGMEVSPGFSEVRVRVSDCFEVGGERSVKPVCHFTRGMLTGLFEKIFGSPAEAVEVSCSAQGGSSCEFVLRRR